MSKLKRILKIFDIRANYLIEEKERDKWINVLRDLMQYPDHEIKEQYERLIKSSGPEYSRYWYLTNVRHLLIKSYNDNRKREEMLPMIKDLFKEKGARNAIPTRGCADYENRLH